MLMEDEQECNTGLALGLAVAAGGPLPSGYNRQKDHKPSPCCLALSVALCPSEEAPIKTDSSISMKDGEDNKRVISKINSKNISGRRKLKLTKEQSSLLENSFKLHTTLTPGRKHTLAEQLNLKPRQVEVWFQNRRARTKLKQTETDCEFLKKCCENLGDENRRLKKELQELRSLKLAAPPQLLVQIPKTTTLSSLCTACEENKRKGGSGP